MAKYTRKNQGIVVIKKSNQLIEARYKFDVWETRIFLSVLSNIKRDDEDFKVYRIWYREVIKSFGLRSGQSYAFLRDAARSLIRKVFNISNEDNGFQRETEYHIIRSINYLTEGEQGRSGTESQEYIDITIDPDMKPLLLQLKSNFTAYDLRNIVKLGAYPVRVYELLKQYESIGERTLEFEEMKRMFELTTEYPHFANFYQKIIQPAVEDINLHTDLSVSEIIKEKEGKRVVALRFRFHRKSDDELRRMRGEEPKAAILPQLPFPDFPNNPAAIAAEASEPSSVDLIFTKYQEEVVQGFGVTPTAFLSLLTSATEEQVAQAVRVTRRAKNAQQLKNVAGFFIEALRNGYTDGQEEAGKKKRSDAEKSAKKLQELLEQLADLEAERRAAANEVIRELTNADAFLAGEAVSKIMSNTPVRQSLEAQTGLTLDAELPMDTWRENKPMRHAVIHQIEAMKPEAFKEVKAKYDGPLLKLRQAVEALQRG